jgi:hypothetical protein
MDAFRVEQDNWATGQALGSTGKRCLLKIHSVTVFTRCNALMSLSFYAEAASDRFDPLRKIIQCYLIWLRQREKFSTPEWHAPARLPQTLIARRT